MENIRSFNKKVRSKFVEIVGEDKKWNVYYFNDKGVGGGRRVFKSYGWDGYERVWERVLVELDLKKEGWSMFEGSSWRGDGSVWGIKKVGS